MSRRFRALVRNIVPLAALVLASGCSSHAVQTSEPPRVVSGVQPDSHSISRERATSSATLGRFATYTISGAGGPLSYLQRASDGNIWFVDGGGSTGTPSIGKITPQGVAEEFSSKFAVTDSSGVLPNNISGLSGAEASVHTGRLYFFWYGTDPVSRESDSGFGSIALADGSMQLYGNNFANSNHSNDKFPNLFASDPLEATPSALWGIYGGGGPGFFEAPFPISTSTLVKHPSPDSHNSAASDMTIGANGDVWYVSNARHVFGDITSATRFSAGTACGSLVAGNDGFLWIPTQAGLARYSYTDDRTLFPYPGRCGNEHTQIVVGSDNSTWTMGTHGNQIQFVRIASAGNVSTYTAPGTPGTAFGYLATGSDGRMWTATDAQTFTVYDASRIVFGPSPFTITVGQPIVALVSETNGAPFTASLTPGTNCANNISITPDSSGTKFTLNALYATNSGGALCILTLTDRDGVGASWSRVTARTSNNV